MDTFMDVLRYAFYVLLAAGAIAYIAMSLMYLFDIFIGEDHD